MLRQTRSHSSRIASPISNGIRHFPKKPSGSKEQRNRATCHSNPGTPMRTSRREALSRKKRTCAQLARKKRFIWRNLDPPHGALFHGKPPIGWERRSRRGFQAKRSTDRWIDLIALLSIIDFPLPPCPVALVAHDGSARKPHQSQKNHVHRNPRPHLHENPHHSTLDAITHEKRKQTQSGLA